MQGRDTVTPVELPLIGEIPDPKNASEGDLFSPRVRSNKYLRPLVNEQGRASQSKHVNHDKAPLDRFIQNGNRRVRETPQEKLQKLLWLKTNVYQA